MDKLTVIKIGGNIIDDALKLTSFIEAIAALKEPFILIHGGGKLATDLAEKLNIPQQMIDGRRVTDAETLKIATMTYAGYINKNIVALLQKNSKNSIGLSGVDGNLIVATKRDSKPINYGFVGDVSKESINISFLKSLIQLGITPVVCAITHDKKGQLLNTNADSIANAIATSLTSEFKIELVYCFEKNGVLKNPEDDSSVIKELDFELFQELKNKEIISKGMLPKIENCFQALKSGVSEIGIINASTIINYINKNNNDGTRIR